MNDYQCPQCKSHIISIDDRFIRCLSCGLTEPLFDYRQANSVIETPISYKQLQSLEDRLQNVEELVANPGSIPRQFHASLQKIQAKELYLESKVNEHLDKSKRKGDRL